MKIYRKSQNSTFLTGNRARTLVAVLALAVILGGAGWAQAAPISIKLTSDALGLGSSDINRGGTVDPDMSGFITSPTTGEGSILTIQTDGLAGPGTVANPLFVTVTAKTRMDVITGLPPAPHDYQAGVLFISKEDGGLPDGSKEGLGVRAFKVDGPSALRLFDSGTGWPLIDGGSKEVSGGTDNSTYDPSNPNGAPHVDEAVKFDFNPLFNVDAMSVEVILSKFDLAAHGSKDQIDLIIKLTSKPLITLLDLGPDLSNTSILEPVARLDGTTHPLDDKLWKLKFSGLSGLGLVQGDLIDYFEIHATEPDPPRGETAEHLLITGFTAVPEPATVVLLGLSSLSLILRRRR